MWTSTSSGRIELQMTKAQAGTLRGPGDVEDEVLALMEIPSIRRQIAKWAPEDVRKELQEYGAWDEEELKDYQRNLVRLVWCLGCNIMEESI